MTKARWGKDHLEEVASGHVEPPLRVTQAVEPREESAGPKTS